jgi:RNA polymerase sigma-70 factor (ECF subfamily)
MGCRHSLAEEIAQESFLRLHRELRDGLQISDVRPWVFRVARNLWIDNRREQHRYDMGLAEFIHIDSAPDPEQQVLRTQQIRLVEEEVLRLPELQRKCVRMKADGFRYHEIAVELDISLNSAVDHVRRAVKRLGKRLNDGRGRGLSPHP